MAHKHVLGKRVIKNSVSSSQHGLTFTGYVPGHAHARTPIIVIGLIQTALSEHHTQTRGRINIGKVAVLFLHDAEIVVTQSQVDGDVFLPVETVLDVTGVRIFKSVAVGVALRLRGTEDTGFRYSSDEGIEGSETEFAAKSAIEDLRNGSTAEFVAELDVVLSGFPRNVIDEMPVGVDSLTRVAIVGAQWGNAGHVDLGQPKIVGVGVRGARVNGVQADAGGIEAAILGEEPLGEAVPAQTHLADDGRRNGGNVGNRNELHARGSGGVVARHESTADQRQREALRAVADVIAAGQQVIGVEVVIDFHDSAVDAIGKRCGQRNVRGDGGLAVIPVAQAGTAQIGSRPGILRQKIGDYRIDDAAVVGRGSGDVLGGRDAGGAGFRAFFTHGFIIDKEESLIALDGPPSAPPN